MAVMNCPKCQGRLRVPDNIPARKVKCPACGTVFAVGGDATPAPGPGPRGGPERPAKPSDLLSRQGQDYEVLDDEPPPTPRRPRDDRDDDFDDRPRRRRRPDYDDYEDDYDDRPRRRDDRPGRPSRQLDPGQLGRVRLGLFLNFIAAWLYVGATSIICFKAIVEILARDFYPAFSVLGGIPGLANWIVAGVGIGFCIAGPRRNGAMGMAIALAAVSLAHFVFIIVGMSQGGGARQFIPSSGAAQWIFAVTLIPILPMYFTAVLKTGELEVPVILLTALLELARIILLMLFIRSIGATARNSGVEKMAIGGVIAFPSLTVGLTVLTLIIVEVAKASGGLGDPQVILVFAVLLYGGSLIGLLCWAAIIIQNAIDAVDARR